MLARQLMDVVRLEATAGSVGSRDLKILYIHRPGLGKAQPLLGEKDHQGEYPFR